MDETGWRNVAKASDLSEKVPVVVDGDAIAIRSCGYLALTFDHRLIDGALGDQFCQKVKQVLENWSGEVL